MLYSAVFGVLVLGDDSSWYTLIGGLLIIVSAILITFDNSKSKPTSNPQLPDQVEDQEPLL